MCVMLVSEADASQAFAPCLSIAMTFIRRQTPPSPNSLITLMGIPAIGVAAAFLVVLFIGLVDTHSFFSDLKAKSRALDAISSCSDPCLLCRLYPESFLFIAVRSSSPITMPAPNSASRASPSTGSPARR